MKNIQTIFLFKTLQIALNKCNSEKVLNTTNWYISDSSHRTLYRLQAYHKYCFIEWINLETIAMRKIRCFYLNLQKNIMHLTPCKIQRFLTYVHGFLFAKPSLKHLIWKSDCLYKLNKTYIKVYLNASYCLEIVYI